MTTLVKALEKRDSGVFRTDRSGDDIQGLAQRAGWRLVDLAITEPTSKAAFLQLCQRAFPLPDHFGHNWDALADCMDDVQDEQGTLVLLRGAHHLESQDREVVRDIFTERVELGAHPFLVVATRA
ncbi:barstar family protein [Calidifontibacter terrae]